MLFTSPLPAVLVTNTSIAFDISARFTPLLNFIDRTRGCCRNHLQMSRNTIHLTRRDFGQKFNGMIRALLTTYPESFMTTANECEITFLKMSTTCRPEIVRQRQSSAEDHKNDTFMYFQQYMMTNYSNKTHDISSL